MRIRLVAIIFLVVVLLASGCAAAGNGASSNFNTQLNSIVSPYTFNLAGWEVSSLFSEIKQSIFDRQPESALTSQSVLEYFSDDRPNQPVEIAASNQPGGQSAIRQ